MTARVALLVLSLLLAPLGAGATAPDGNRLSAEASPYLRLHASDPVHWRTWSAETLAAAKAAGKPILLSIGYLACHWCHVMQEESYGDARTATLVNRLFTPILIDREERPDLDHAFQHAALLLDLPTGWPLTLFLTPDGQPFWGGTYFPKQAVGGMAAFADVLALVAETHAQDPAGLAGEAARVAGALKEMSKARAGAVTLDALDQAAAALLTQADSLSGGFGEGAKFPQVPAQEMLWRAYLRSDDTRFAQAVRTTLAHMTGGGMADHVGGGFFRYTVDPLWHVPHFEKMLDTNATVLSLLVAVWRDGHDLALAARIERTVGFLLAELRLDDGAFASALDAVSAGAGGETEEGAYYVWDEAGVRRALGADAGPFLAAFGLAPPDARDADGTPVVGAGVPYRRDPAARTEFAPQLAALKAARDVRPRPRRDDKVLADWNGYAIRALGEAGVALARPDWLAAAERAFGAVTKRLDVKGRLHHASAAGRTSGPATAGGLAAMAAAAIELYEATGRDTYLDHARRWAADAVRHHSDPDGVGYFASADDSGPVSVRTKILTDVPNTGDNAALLDVFSRLGYLTGERRWRDAAQRLMAGMGGILGDVHPGIAGFANGAETTLNALQIVVVGDRADAGTAALLGTVATTPLAARTVLVVAPGAALPEGHPARYKGQIDGIATAYVCRGQVCSLPGVSASELKETLDTMRRTR